MHLSSTKALLCLCANRRRAVPGVGGGDWTSINFTLRRVNVVKSLNVGNLVLGVRLIIQIMNGYEWDGADIFR